ncbi:spore cortex biosynthesis protein YabQ [Heyndrickxia vini]|uniref:Spore cortex biosynthesis protein YabQ n=1 Tax=Heyndrickxia vini TaxID=1476025 RepID=A0ABX7E570_9BACI|nr:spore cortex biosynthesis protein YabQ [Heyndrickxia vini]QQZ09502.1 spore cortex biosynthesis protein YabQ [Heyndrickxia vini]
MSLATQFYTMLAMISMGSFFGATLDTYNRFLKRSVRKRWIVFIHDVMFWLLQGLLIFYILFLVNFGEIRFYIFVALVCGFAAYQALMKTTYLKLLETIIYVTITIVSFLKDIFTALIYNPLKWMIILFITILVGIGKGLYSLVQFILKVLLLMVKILFKPIIWIGKILWRVFPTSVKKYIEKFYIGIEGIAKKGTNKLVNGFKIIFRSHKNK